MSKTMAKGGFPARPAATTKEEKEAAVMRAIAQRRESFATGIMYNLCHGIGKAGEVSEAIIKAAAHLAVVGADALVAELYIEHKEEVKA